MDPAYDTEAFYHYADEPPNLTDPGYLATGESVVEQEKYEQPLEPVEFRRPVYATTPRKPDPPRRNSYPVIPSVPSVPSKTNRIGLFGLLGLLGLVGLSYTNSGSPGSASSQSVGAAGCIVGTVIWSLASSPPSEAYLVADGSAFDTAKYADLATLLGAANVPNLVSRYARGAVGNEVGVHVPAGVDVSGVGISISDPGHVHTSGAPTYGVQRDGQFTLAHLYSFDTDGMNLKDSGPILTKSETGITAQLIGGDSETRPESIGLLPLVCASGDN